MDEFRGSFSDTVTDVLTGAASIEDAFKSLANQVVAQLARMAANRLTESLFGPAGSTSGGSSGGLLSSLFGAFLGGGSAAPGTSGSSSFLDAFSVNGYANGTMNAPGGWSLVGERGPELVNLPRGSQVIPNGRMPGGATIVQNINVAANTSKATATQLAEKSGRRAQVALSRNG